MWNIHLVFCFIGSLFQKCISYLFYLMFIKPPTADSIQSAENIRKVTRIQIFNKILWIESLQSPDSRAACLNDILGNAWKYPRMPISMFSLSTIGFPSLHFCRDRAIIFKIFQYAFYSVWMVSVFLDIE